MKGELLNGSVKNAEEINSETQYWWKKKNCFCPYFTKEEYK